MKEFSTSDEQQLEAAFLLLLMEKPHAAFTALQQVWGCQEAPPNLTPPRTVIQALLAINLLKTYEGVCEADVKRSRAKAEKAALEEEMAAREKRMKNMDEKIRELEQEAELLEQEREHLSAAPKSSRGNRIPLESPEHKHGFCNIIVVGEAFSFI